MKKIIIFGSNEVGKSTIQKEIRKILKPDKKNCPVKSVVNYVEDVFRINGHSFRLIDTFSFEFINKSDNQITREMKILNNNLISLGDMVIWVIDSGTDFSDYNFSLQSYLEKKNKKYIIIFNKFDFSLRGKEEYLNDHYVQKILKKDVRFYFLPLLSSKEWSQDLKFILATELNFKEISKKDAIIKRGLQDEELFKLTIFGPPNSGKSTLLNSLVEYQRSVVSFLEGTTKEEVITQWFWNEINFQLKDTKGIVNKSRNDRSILKSCQIAWVVIDINKQITKQSLQIISLAEKCEKALVIILNKIDICNNYQIEEKKEEIRSRLKSFSFVPIICISAKNRSNFSSLFESLEETIKQSKLTFKKNELAKQFDLILKKSPPSSIGGKRLKVYYSVHENGLVHKFITFVNNPNLVHFSYKRYIVNNLRKNLKIKILPIKIIFKKS